jgi:hypothetical protein
LAEVEHPGVLESDGVTASAVIGIDELNVVWQFARLHGSVGVPFFVI